MREVGWTFFFMFVVLKIPICALFYLVWWATRAPEPTDEEPARTDGNGGWPHGPRRPRRPPPPRRGAHGAAAPRSPARMRSSARRLTRSHG